MRDEGLAAVVCVGCEAGIEATVLPHACFRCGARFDLEAPALLVVLTVGVSSGLAIDIGVELRRHGAWGAELAGVEERLRRGALRLVEDD